MDGWSCIAVILVLAGHFAFSTWAWDALLGADVIFILTGMLLQTANLWSLSVEEHRYVIMSIMSLLPIACGKFTLVLFSINFENPLRSYFNQRLSPNARYRQSR